MSQVGTGDHRHSIAINVGAAGDGSSSCAVCMEPLEWAAIGPCGHGDICLRCALHIRVFQNNRSRCICRALCPIVVITRHDAIAAASGDWPAVSSRLPKQSQLEGRIGECWWYHSGMEAFFHDERQYTTAKAAARLGRPPSYRDAPPPPHTSYNFHGRRSLRDCPEEDESCISPCEVAVGLGLVLILVFLIIFALS